MAAYQTGRHNIDDLVDCLDVQVSPAADLHTQPLTTGIFYSFRESSCVGEYTINLQ